MRKLGAVSLALLVFACGAAGWADNVVLNVPDWNQPDNYADGVKLFVGDYPNWCAPTAGADVMGYWEDVQGHVGLTDRKNFYTDVPNSPAYPATAGTWQQGLWHDGTIELGWHMDTGSWQSGPKPFPPKAGFTPTNLIAPGVMSFASSAYVDATGITKVAHANAVVNTENAGQPAVNLASMWPNYTAEIDAGRPVICSFLDWVNWQNLTGTQNLNIGGQVVTVEFYPWAGNVGDHSVAGVGYIDATPAVYNGDEFFIAQDTWSTTGQYVAVPVDNMWFQNDYVDFVTGNPIPEPGSALWLLLGALGLARNRRHG